jgi:hypothetical protein
MLGPNLTIFDSTAALDGRWYKIANYSALSVHLMGLEASCAIWIEVSNNPENDPNYGSSPPITTAGVPVAWITTGGITSPPTNITDEADLAYSLDGTQAMWSPSCLVWNYIRVCKSSSGTPVDETVAQLFGQINS